MPASISFSNTAASQSKYSIYRKPAKKPMSLTSVYFLAHSARGKLSKEASRADHDLRLLVGHANMLDSLMIDLANAEQEQERWFSKSVASAKESEAPEPQELPEDADSMEEEDSEEEDEETKPETIITTTEIDSDDEENFGDLTLTRTTSRHSPPELSTDSDSESEDEQMMPPSPPQPTITTFTEKQRQAIATTSFYDSKDTSLSPTEQETFQEEGFFLPSRQQPTIIAAY
jgi:hypothetical protein